MFDDGDNEWDGDDMFKQQLQRCLVDPLERGDTLFHPQLLPVRRLIVVFGNVSSNKCSAIERFCCRARIPVCVADAAPQHQETLLSMTRTAVEPNGVLLISNACSLYHEVTSEAVSRWVINLNEYATNNNLIVVACCHRLLRVSPSSGATGYRTEMASMFSRAHLYFPPPTRTARYARLKWIIQQLSVHFSHVTVSLTEDEVQLLSDMYMDMCSTGDVLAYLQNIWYNETHVTFAIASGPPYVVNNECGVPHVIPYNLQLIENAYSQAAGQGPRFAATSGARPTKRARPVDQQPDKEGEE